MIYVERHHHFEPFLPELCKLCYVFNKKIPVHTLGNE
jgi:hypothetical protein